MKLTVGEQLHSFPFLIGSNLNGVNNHFGIGIGLFVTKTIVEAHGWKIGVNVLDNRVVVRMGLALK